MAKRTIHMLVDDLDGGEANESITFELDGKRYEIDLSTKNAQKMRDLLAPYTTAGSKLGRISGVKPKKTNGYHYVPRQPVVKDAEPAAEIVTEPEPVPVPYPEPKKTVPPAQRDTSTYTRTEVPAGLPPDKEIRAWMREHRPNVVVSDRGRLKPEIREIYRKAHSHVLNDTAPDRGVSGKGNRLGDQVTVKSAPAKRRGGRVRAGT